MKHSGPRHGAVFVKTLAEDLLAEGYTPEQVFAASSFGPELLEREKPFAEFSDIAAFFEHAADMTGNDALGFDRGTAREMRRIGLLCYVGLSSPNVHDYLKNIARYRRVFSDAVEIDLSLLDEKGVLMWHFSVPSNVSRRQYVEFGASGILSSLRQATGHKIKLQHATFRHARKTNVDRFRDYLGCQIDFCAPVNSFTFSRVDLERPLATADNELYAVLTQYAEDVLQSRVKTASELVVDVERAIADRLAAGEANQDTISRAMGMSPRTLARRLAGEQTTFFRVLEDLRKSLASSYLKNSDLGQGEIAFLLGYSSLSSFHDAFKRWSGQTPGQFRAG